MKKQTAHTAPKTAYERPPVVAIVGHIDHGKSTLLDYIRKTNVVATEAGGITQHLSAYQAQHAGKTITFLDTPGHAAFAAMRSRGLEVADVAILVVSAEEGVKPQTLEALKLIEGVGIPYVVALTKIDKPGADLVRAKNSLVEHGIYLEGYGGNIPSVPVSGKSGEGVPELLDLILLAAELEGLTADAAALAAGIVIEAHVDIKRGTSATLIVQTGTLRSGEYVVSGVATAPVRIMENFLGKAIKEAPPGTPVRIVGFSSLPAVGDPFSAVGGKKDAEVLARQAAVAAGASRNAAAAAKSDETTEEVEKMILPIIIKTDVAGTGEAVVHELQKLTVPSRMELRVVGRSVGTISEADVKLAAGKTAGIILGFNVKADAVARELAERQGIKIELFDIIYKLSEWLVQELEARRPLERTENVTGSAKILKVFSAVKGKVVLGGRVEDGSISEREEVRIMRRDVMIGTGEILSLQSQKVAVKTVEAGAEFGAMLSTKAEPAAGDHLECFTVEMK